MRTLSAVPAIAYANSTATSVPEIPHSTPRKATSVTPAFRTMSRNDSELVVKLRTSSLIR